MQVVNSSKARIVTNGGPVSLQLHEHAREVKCQGRSIIVDI